MLNLAELGTSYTIQLSTTGETSIVHIIMFDDIKEKLNMPAFLNVGQYQKMHERMIKRTRPLTNDANSVSWHTTTEDDFDIGDAVKQCKMEKNDIIIVEILRDDEVSSGWDH